MNEPRPVAEAVARPVASLGDYGLFLYDFAVAVVRHGVPWREIVAQAYAIGVRSLPILLVIASFVGTNLALQGHAAFHALGGERLVGMFVSLAGVRELAPMIAASMVAAKAGTEMASQIAVMRIREQIDALEVMAVNSLAWLVAPRLGGILLVLPALTLIAIFSMVGSGYLVAVHQLGISGHSFMAFATEGVGVADLWYGVVKAMVFGLVIVTVSCWYGFRATSGPEGVGRATNLAVVTSAIACVAINYFLSELLYGGGG